MKFTMAESTQLAFIVKHIDHEKAKTVLEVMSGDARKVAEIILGLDVKHGKEVEVIAKELVEWADQCKVISGKGAETDGQ